MLKDTYIKKIEFQEFDFENKENSKLNIHFPVYGWIKDECISLNKEIHEITNNEIDFSPQAFQIPHITILMGYVKTLEDYTKICNILEKFTKTINSFNISFSKPYIKNNENYIFIDIKESKKIINIKKELYKSIQPYFEIVKWDILNEPPHITIGYITMKREKVNQIIDVQIPNNILTVNRINISLCGLRGTCLGTLREFNSK